MGWKRFFSNHPKSTIIITNAIFFVFALVFLEIFSRYLVTSNTSNDFIKLAKITMMNNEKLTIINMFYTDKEGVYKANRDFDWSTKRWGLELPSGIYNNSDGFRSIEFNYQETIKKKILFLGDSFTWGAGANPINKSFPDLLAQHGFLIYNTGIVGTGPNQYAFLAEKYVPVLKPNYVMVMLYMGNDINWHKDPMIPHKNLFHIIEMGGKIHWIYGFDDAGNPLSPEEAIRYRVSVDSPYKKSFREIVTSSTIGTKLWVTLAAWWKNGNKIEKNKYVIESLERISDICNKYNAIFLLFVIPVKQTEENPNNSINDNIFLIKKFSPNICPNLTVDCYEDGPDAHFNNKGHEIYARFIIQTLGEIN